MLYLHLSFKLVKDGKCGCPNRLQLLEALIPVFGIGKGDGFGLEPLMKFVGATLGNANADVRAAAMRITVLVSFSSFLASF